MSKRFTTIVAAMAVAGFTSFAANAGDTPSNTQEWAQEAGTAINEVMHYPNTARFLGRTGEATYKVTIDRDGNVVNYRSASSSGTRSLDKASERALNNADFPAVPESFSGDQLTFSLVMEYREYQSPARKSYLDAKKRKQGAVTGTRIAILSGTGLAAAK